MKRSVWGFLLASFVLVLFTLPASAHHSVTAAYDPEKFVTVKGVVTQIRLENPHSWFFLEARDASGKVEKWAFEGGTPSGMIRNGFKPNTIKVGTEITVKALPARDSKNTGLMREIVTADGRTFGAFGAQIDR